MEANVTRSVSDQQNKTDCLLPVVELQCVSPNAAPSHRCDQIATVTTWKTGLSTRRWVSESPLHMRQRPQIRENTKDSD